MSSQNFLILEPDCVWVLRSNIHTTLCHGTAGPARWCVPRMFSSGIFSSLKSPVRDFLSWEKRPG